MAASGLGLQEIVNALLRWKGNVRAAAEELGIRRKSLYERIERAGIDLAAMRGAQGSVDAFPAMSRMPRMTRNMTRNRVSRGVPNSAGAPY